MNIPPENQRCGRQNFANPSILLETNLRDQGLEVRIGSRSNSASVFTDADWDFRSPKQSGMLVPNSQVQDIATRREADGDLHGDTALNHSRVALGFKICTRLLHRCLHELALTRVRLDFEIQAAVSPGDRGCVPFRLRHRLE